MAATTTPCVFVTAGQAYCPAFSDTRSTRGFCFAHEEIYWHDAAVVYRRKKRENETTAYLWAQRLGLSVEELQKRADALKQYERPIAIEVQ